jgi:hypothetical protein
MINLDFDSKPPRWECLMAHGGARPGAGRPRGSKSRRTVEVEQRLAELGCDPLAGLARIAQIAEAENPPNLDLAYRCLTALAPYVAPKLARLDHGLDIPDRADWVQVLAESRQRALAERPTISVITGVPRPDLDATESQAVQPAAPHEVEPAVPAVAPVDEPREVAAATPVAQAELASEPETAPAAASQTPERNVAMEQPRLMLEMQRPRFDSQPIPPEIWTPSFDD